MSSLLHSFLHGGRFQELIRRMELMLCGIMSIQEALAALMSSCVI